MNDNRRSGRAHGWPPPWLRALSPAAQAQSDKPINLLVGYAAAGRWMRMVLHRCADPAK